MNGERDSILFHANIYIQGLERPLWLGKKPKKLLQSIDFRVLIFSTGEIKDINGNTIDSLSIKKRSKYSLSNCITANKWYRKSSQKYAIVTSLLFMDSLRLDYKSEDKASYTIRQDAKKLTGYIYEIVK